MLQILLYILFILSVALAAGGILLSSKLRIQYQHNIFSTLLYYQVFIFTFGFYGIWGQVVIRAFLSEYISLELLFRFADFAMLLGLPFLVFGWLMLIQFSIGTYNKKINNWIVFWFLLFNFSIIFIVGYYITKTSDVRPQSLIKYYFIIMNFIYSLLASLLIFFSGKRRSIFRAEDKKIITVLLLLTMITQTTPLLFNISLPLISLIFIFTFFTGNTFLPIYLNYGVRMSIFKIEANEDLSFQEFCKKFEVSPRETDIVREICNGLSNQEISDKLFISLQTVKDHTHRIFIKTNVKSRVQLITLINKLSSD